MYNITVNPYNKIVKCSLFQENECSFELGTTQTINLKLLKFFIYLFCFDVCPDLS